MARVGPQRHREKKCMFIFTVNLGHVVPEVALNVEAFLAITTECFSDL